MVRDPLNVGAQTVRVLRNGDEAFPAMLSAIDRARRSIRIEMYWWEPDAVGQRFLDHLTEAAARGVDVRVLFDAFGSFAQPRRFWDPLRRSGGKVSAFHPLPGWPTVHLIRTLLARDHRKTVIADDHSFVGGLNFALPWTNVADGGENWRDTAVEIVGTKIADDLVQLFEETWAVVNREHLSQRAIDDTLQATDDIVIYSNTPSERNGRRIRRAYLQALREARSTIDITCAYFAPRPLFLRTLSDAVDRGVRVRLLVPARSDVELARVASLPLLRWLARRGVQVFGYGDSILHAKTAVVDGHWCTVGSHNLDGLSWAWNLECNVVARSSELGAQLTSLFEEDLSLSTSWPPARLGLVERLFPNALRRWYESG